MTEGHPESKQPVQMEEDSISLLDLLVVFAKHKKKILLVPILAGGIAAVYSLQLPFIFSSQTTLLPPQQQKQSSAMAMLNQMGPMAGLAGDALGLVIGSLSDLICLRFLKVPRRQMMCGKRCLVRRPFPSGARMG